MKEFAAEFYRTKAWREMRAYIFRRDFGLCVRCHGIGKIAHHKVWLTPKNINDTSITLNPDLLELLCESCHALEHEGRPATGDGLRFTADGELIEVTE